MRRRAPLRLPAAREAFAGVAASIIETVRTVSVGEVHFGAGHPLALIAGPCVIESAGHAEELAEAVRDISARVRIPFVFKASFDKANRTSLSSFRGPGLTRGLDVLASIKQRLGCPILTDVHEPSQTAPVAEVADILQIPAFLCRQTDLIVSAAATGRAVNLKKGQFLAPLDMRHVIAKATAGGQSAGARHRARDHARLPRPGRGHARVSAVAIDATIRSCTTSPTACSFPVRATGSPAARAEFIEPLAAAGVAAGVDAVFFEVHERPAAARSDGRNALPLARLEPLLRRLLAIRQAAHPFTVAAEATLRWRPVRERSRSGRRTRAAPPSIWPVACCASRPRRSPRSPTAWTTGSMPPSACCSSAGAE